MLSLEQDRARYTWERISLVKSYGKEVKGRYKSYVKSAGMLILTNGLGNSVAFFKSKFGTQPDDKLSPDDRAYKLLYDHIDNWCKKQLMVEKDFLEWVVNDATSLQIFRITNEVLALLSWLKRFAESELTGD